MPFSLILTPKAKTNLAELSENSSLQKRLKAVKKALGYLENNPRHPALNTHKYHSTQGECSFEIFEAYAENNTPGAYRIFWHYGPKRNQITILSISAHP